MAVQFGRQQLKNPTPSGLDFWVKLYVAVAGAFLGWMITQPFIGVHAQAIISSVIGFTITLATIVAPFFGVVVNPNEKVDVHDVTTMEANPTDDKGKP